MSDLVRQLPRTNTITFPSALREAIPARTTADGRILVLDSMSGGDSWSIKGHHIRLRLVAKETGKLNGEFPILIDLNADAARQFAEMLIELADQVDPTHSKM